MRILIFHGYLLEGTGSNVYNARLAEALVRLGHDVHLLSQDRHPQEHAFVDAAGDWDSGALRIRALRASSPGFAAPAPLAPPTGEDPNGGDGGRRGRCTVYRPDIGPLLPVYVADRYEGIEARTFAACSDAEIERYIDANVAAVRELVELVDPQLALANHLVMGPVILARALAPSGVPYAVKVHGSALEYTVKPDPERFLPFAREGVARARAILVGSHHTAASLWRALGDPGVVARTRLGPPGVDVARFAPRDRQAAQDGVRALAGRLRAGARDASPLPSPSPSPARSSPPAPAEVAGSQSAFARDALAAAQALERLNPGEDRLVAFVGKLILNKGVDLLLAAWPLVLAQVPDARLVVVGFGADRELFERLLETLAGGEIEQVQEGALPHLRVFLDGLAGAERSRYLEAARALRERVVFTGRLDHEELADLLPACEALVVPSTFPEAFGMVAAEAAACGALPVSAGHSGLAEVSETLAGAVGEQVAPWLSFPIDDRAVASLAQCVFGWLQAEPALRARTRERLVVAVREHWSWQGVARGVIAAASGELGSLREP
jgi:glycosyltransferase involved in cell wall biosynthesis